MPSLLCPSSVFHACKLVPDASLRPSKPLCMATRSKLGRPESSLQPQQLLRWTRLDLSHSPIRPRTLGSPTRQPSVSLRLRQHVGNDDRPKQSPARLLYGLIHHLPTAIYHRTLL